MRRLLFYAFIGCSCVVTSAAFSESSPAVRQTVLEPFTGRITGNQVRVRLEPNVESPILREINQDELVVVTDANNDFYAIQPPTGTKAFVYRTYVIDDVVEGNRVNVRAAPDLESPIIAQLNKGDKVEGHVSPLNNKWLQIHLPASVRFYVAAEFVEKIGDANMVAKLEQRQRDASERIERANAECQDELCKPFPYINLEVATRSLRRVADEYSDMPEEQQKALRCIAAAQDNYMRKKIEHLEGEAKQATDTWHQRCQDLAKQMEAQNAHLEALEKSLESRNSASLPPTPESMAPPPASENAVAAISQDKITEAMSVWMPREADLFEAWLENNPGGSMEAFYAEQLDNSLQLRGKIQPYRRVVKNKPGNFVLMDQQDDIPIAFLYSTKVNLDRQIGKTVTLRAAPRPNNNFAFPAYFILSVD